MFTLLFILTTIIIVVVVRKTVFGSREEPYQPQPSTSENRKNIYNTQKAQSPKVKVATVDNSKALPDYTVVDLETTGLNYRKDRIIQFSAIKVRDHKVVDSLSFFVNPEMPIPEEASKINGIKDKDVESELPFVDRIPEILKFIGDDAIVGHNIINFDRYFLEYQLGESLPNLYADTLQFAKENFKSSNYKLTTLYRYFTSSTPQKAHDALYDCQMTYEIQEAMIKALSQNGKYVHLETFKSISWVYYELPKREFQKREEIADQSFSKQHVVFDGKITNLTRRQAIQAVIDRGGNYGHELRQKTTLVVMGEQSNKGNWETIAQNRKAPESPIRLLTQDEFKEMIGINSTLA